MLRVREYVIWRVKRVVNMEDNIEEQIETETKGFLQSLKSIVSKMMIKVKLFK